jgi:ankyrin repeat protein
MLFWCNPPVIVDLLLRRGEEAMVKDKEGLTPLSRAAENGHKKVVRLLVHVRADKDTPLRSRYFGRTLASLCLADPSQVRPLAWVLYRSRSLYSVHAYKGP